MGPRPRVSRSASPAKASSQATDSAGTRWFIQRATAWLTGYRRLTLRYERKAGHFLGFLFLGVTFTCYKNFAHTPHKTRVNPFG
jgi:hypothetical protein